MPPSIWPSTRVGLIALPTSWAATMRSTFTVPSSISTSTIGDLRGEGIGRIGNALAVGVERRGRRIEGALAHQRSPAVREIDHAHLAAVAHREPGAVERQRGVRPGIGQAQDLLAQVAAGALGRLAGDEGLARGRGLAGIGGEVGVARDQRELRRRQAQRIGRDLGHDGVGALADIDRAAVERQRAGRRQADPHARGVGHRGVADAVPHAADADAAPLRRRLLH